ncbi:MAG: phosphoribosyltransferase family protein [Bacteroidota bacterium]|nr:phosphoribosyltransferase family protein [Bacteroidota bacterium]
MNTSIMHHQQVEQKLNRLAWQVYEKNTEEPVILLAGIAQRGYAIAQRLESYLASISNIKIELLKITVDKEKPSNETTILDKDIATLSNSPVVVVDDVLNSGRTLVFALTPFIKNKHPQISTLVLVDRNHRRFPMHADFVGMSLATTMQEHVEVTFENGKFEVFLQ